MDENAIKIFFHTTVTRLQLALNVTLQLFTQPKGDINIESWNGFK